MTQNLDVRAIFLFWCQPESQLPLLCSDSVIEVIIWRNVAVQLLDDLICQIGFHSCCNAPECTVAIGNQPLILNQFDSSGGKHIFVKPLSIQQFQATAQEVMLLHTQMPFGFGVCQGVH